MRLNSEISNLEPTLPPVCVFCTCNGHTVTETLIKPLGQSEEVHKRQLQQVRERKCKRCGKPSVSTVVVISGI